MADNRMVVDQQNANHRPDLDRSVRTFDHARSFTDGTCTQRPSCPDRAFPRSSRRAGLRRAFTHAEQSDRMMIRRPRMP
jgi:hypothetical protein